MRTVTGETGAETRGARRSLTLAAAAVPLAGGQGLNLAHMIDALGPCFDVNLFARGPSTKVRTQLVPPSPLGKLMRAVPLVRRLRSVHVGADDAYFDRWVAASMPRSHIFQGAVGQCAESLVAAKRRGARAVLDVVNMHVDQLRSVSDRECKKMGVPPPFSSGTVERMKREYAHADLVRVMSHVAKRSFLERGFEDDRIVVANPPFDSEEFPVASFDEPVFRVAYVGLLEPWKGFQYLIEAFTRLPVADAELVLWGGPGHAAISRFVGEAIRRDPRIRLRPTNVRTAGLREVYGKASVLVLPSLTDGFGYAAGEAMASGVPVIVTPDVGAADIVKDGVNGYIVPPGDVGAIHERLALLAGNPDLVRRMGAAARDAARALTLVSFRESWATRLEAL